MLHADDETKTRRKRCARSSTNQERDAVLWKPTGLTEEQVRRPMTPSGTSREPGPLWFDPYIGEDMSAGPADTTARITDFYARARAAAERVLTELTLGKPTWRDDECSLRWVLVRMTAETARHAGHMDILRELIDGSTDRRIDGSTDRRIDGRVRPVVRRPEPHPLAGSRTSRTCSLSP